MEKKKKVYDALRAKFVYNNIEIPDNRKVYRVLIVEDHPIMQKQLAVIFKTINKTQEKYFFKLDMAFTCKEAFEHLSKNNNSNFDFIILDIHLPGFKEQNLFSGEDIGVWIRKNLIPNPKIIIITYLNENFRIKNLLKNIKPDALLVKDEINCEIIADAINHTIEHIPFFTSSVSNVNKRVLYDDIILDVKDRRLLFELSLGATMDELTEALSLSKGAIRNRKIKLFDALEVIEKSNKQLVLKAKELGFI